MTTDKESRWSSNFSPELPKRKGVVNNVNKFDAAFFGVRFKLYIFCPSKFHILTKTF